VPVARGPRLDARSTLTIAATAVVLLVVVGGILLYLTSQDGLDVRLGDDTFQDIDAESTAETIAEGGPFPLEDLTGGSRQIFVQHLGDDPETGWFAFAVRPLGEPRECFVEWRPESRTFTDNGECSRTYTFPEDGAGLPQYPATVNDDGKVVIDLNAADRETTTTSESTTTSEG
jgi:hypothetical protein